MIKDVLSLPVSVRLERLPNLGSAQRQDLGGEQGGVDGSGLADRHRRDGDSARHLHDGKKGIDAFQDRGFDRNADDGKDCFRGAHAGKVGRSSRSRDDDLDAARRRRAGVFEEQIRSSVSGYHLDFVLNFELLKHRGAMLKGFPVGGGTHHDADQRWHGAITLLVP